MLRIAQWLSKNHAHSLPLQGTSMIIPSILTAGPNFMGHVFWDGIQKSWLYLKESFLQSWLASHHTIRLERQYYNYKRFWHISAFMRNPSITAVNPPSPAQSSLSVREFTIGMWFSSGMPGPVQDDTMTRESLKQEVRGTQAGYIIRFTCPSCHTENAIINKTPKDFYRKIRDARCHHCKKSSTVTTPAMNQKPG